ncbi:MAG: M23 family metallopeptidase [Proteobacteria bacterium]|nr:M23 family metallopeptidase [Pseudomonadota bacterium]
MIRSVAFSALGALALAGCASIDYEPVATQSTAMPSVPAPTTEVSSGVDPAIYLNAPRAPLLSQLFACSANNSNIGPISADRASLVYTPYINTAAGALLRDPTEGACLSSGFGWRARGETGSNHTGIDLANPNGGFIFAAGDGVVEYSGWQGGYGIVVEIDHGRGVHTFYGHLTDINPSLHQGSFVHGGTAIARMGMTGNATGIHLHYEVSIDGLKVDPLNYGAPQVVQVNQSHDQPIDAPPPTQTQISAPPASDTKPDTSAIETPAPSSQTLPTAPAAPPQPPATEPFQVTPGDDGWTPGKSN